MACRQTDKQNNPHSPINSNKAISAIAMTPQVHNFSLGIEPPTNYSGGFRKGLMGLLFGLAPRFKLAPQFCLAPKIKVALGLKSQTHTKTNSLGLHLFFNESNLLNICDNKINAGRAYRPPSWI